MAAVAPAVNQATDLLHKLSLDQQAKTNGASDGIKKPNVSAEGMDRTNSLAPSFERSMTPLLQDYVDPSMCYLPNGYPSGPFYYNAYDGSVADWDDYRYMNSDEMPHAGVYGDMYHHGFGYATYGAYSPGSPVPTVGHDGQLYGHQHYQYPNTYYAVNSTYAPNNPAPSSQPEIPTVSSEQPTPTVDAVKPILSNGNAKVLPSKPAAQNALAPSGSPTDSRYSHNGTRSTVPWLDSATVQDGANKGPTTSSVSSPVFHPGSNLSSRHHHGMRPFPHMMGLSSPRPNSGIGPGGPGIMNSLYPNARIYGNAYRADARGWVPVDSKYKPRGRGGSFFPYGNENIDGIGELNRGPRSGRAKVQKTPLTNITIAVKGQPLPTEGNKETSTVPDKDLYNKEDFPEEYADARFFIIKSYSEDDVHKSIKYNVWASTASGNKKLDAAYQESKSKNGTCPVFLLFSVNTSGQFVGMAEMVGNVDFEKTVEYWQQDKWMGCFPVKWHIIKDVPNRILKHITLENNENKPVTNSRDTQEVKLEQGIQMLKLFKEHVSKTSILDDFIFYEARQKTMQDRRAKQQQFQKQVWDEKAREVECKVRIQKPGSLAAVTKEALVELKTVEENGGGV